MPNATYGWFLGQYFDDIDYGLLMYGFRSFRIYVAILDV